VLNDFEPVALIASTPQLIVARKTMPANDLKELIAWLKANPDRASQATSGLGGYSHLAGLFFPLVKNIRGRVLGPEVCRACDIA
jgi:tripartite-type tricarboxylate transporter receptor subunit TctC